MLARKLTTKTMLEEIEKCDLVCAICHRVRTIKRLRGEEDYLLWVK